MLGKIPASVPAMIACATKVNDEHSTLIFRRNLPNCSPADSQTVMIDFLFKIVSIQVLVQNGESEVG